MRAPRLRLKSTHVALLDSTPRRCSSFFLSQAASQLNSACRQRPDSFVRRRCEEEYWVLERSLLGSDSATL